MALIYKKQCKYYEYVGEDKMNKKYTNAEIGQSLQASLRTRLDRRHSVEVTNDNDIVITHKHEKAVEQNFSWLLKNINGYNVILRCSNAYCKEGNFDQKLETLKQSVKEHLIGLQNYGVLPEIPIVKPELSTAELNQTYV